MSVQGRGRRGWTGLLLGAILIGGFAAEPSWANLPFAGQHYPNGAEDFVSGALPPPGFYLKNYFALIQKDRLMDNDGNKTSDALEVDVTAIVPRFIWMTPVKVLGANLGAYAVFPLYWADVELTNAEGVALVDSDDSGLGDIPFAPLLAWHFSPNFHFAAAVEFVAPTGDYQSDDPASQILSKNHWTIEPLVAVTYLWNGFDFSAKIMYDFNTKNDDYSYGPFPGELTPGQEFHFDWGLSYARSEGLRYGLSGYAYWQTTKDEFDADDPGMPTIKGDKGRIFSAGPTIKYWPKQGRFSATLKHQWEFGAKNLPEGQATWLNIVWVF